MVGFLDFFNARRRIKRNFKRELGYSPNLKNPQTYCEKIQWLKLNHNANDQRIIERADKYLVRKFIEEQGFAEYLVTLYGCWDRPEDIDWDDLPDKLVLKLNNGSGTGYMWLVEKKSEFDKDGFLTEVKERMQHKYGYKKGEFHYGQMPVKIIAEAYLGDIEKPVTEYKFYCFHGQIGFISVQQGRFLDDHVREYYNTEWERSPVEFYGDVSRPEKPFERPDTLHNMVIMAETLSKGYPHVRVDLYNADGKIYFGELTYTSTDGLTQWKPQSLDLKFGKLMDIHNISH
ncbi:ATP-grasp fold amidoligase family protein [Amphritea sp. HPY]|uniref:ATP-grasp fold amidoligase family protein n=1 Tax=Amphritea sp. HPY TaxID=3421652 RepID=UPI003D7C7088